MKRVFTLLLVAAMCFSLAACAGSGEPEKYKKYEALFDYMEAEDYEGALAEITRMSEKSKDTGTPETSQQKEAKSAEIEITPENWQEYFELKQYLSVYYEANAFNEATRRSLTLMTILKPKEEYSDYNPLGITFQYDVDYSPRDVVYHLEDFSFELTNCVSHPEATVEERNFVRNKTAQFALEYGTSILRFRIVDSKVVHDYIQYTNAERGEKGRFGVGIDSGRIEENEDGTGFIQYCPANFQITRIEGTLKYDA